MLAISDHMTNVRSPATCVPLIEACQEQVKSKELGRSADYSKQKGAVAATLDIIGEPWTLLIIRDAFLGTARFEQWQERLGLARNVLAARLKHLVAHGIFEPVLYCERPKRYEYLLTDKGRELQPIIVHMLDWGQRNVYGDQPSEISLVHSCGHAFKPVTVCDACDKPMVGSDVTVVHNDNAKTLSEIYGERA